MSKYKTYFELYELIKYIAYADDLEAFLIKYRFDIKNLKEEEYDAILSVIIEILKGCIY